MFSKAISYALLSLTLAGYAAAAPLKDDTCGTAIATVTKTTFVTATADSRGGNGAAVNTKASTKTTSSKSSSKTNSAEASTSTKSSSSTGSKGTTSTGSKGTTSTGSKGTTSTGSKGSTGSTSTTSTGSKGSTGSTSTTSTGNNAAAGNSATGNSAASNQTAIDALQSSLTLDKSVLATGFENDGQDVPAAGQVASITSSNNFINFCATVPNLPITNGQQVKTGSCNPAPMGVIASTANMPSSKFVFPTNFGTVQANTAFTVQMAIKNLDTGFFVNAQENYFAAPQFTNAQGQIQGHSHVVIEEIDSLATTTPSDPTKFAFFKGLNAAAVNGVLTADVTSGLPAGTYKISSINSAANHQPVLVAVAQHGSLDDVVYFTVTDDGNSTSSASSASSSTASSSTASIASSSSASSSSASKASSTSKGNAAAATTTASSAAAAAATSAASASTALGNFGSCSTPQISFAAGLDGRTETAFVPTDLKSFNHGSADNIQVITSFICGQLPSACKADATAQATCAKAQSAALAATPAKSGAQADAFNAVFGKTTNFASVKVVA